MYIFEVHGQPTVKKKGASGNGKRKRKAEIWKWSSEFKPIVSGQCAYRCVVASECELIYMPTWLNNRGIVVVTASTSIHSLRPSCCSTNMEATVSTASMKTIQNLIVTRMMMNH